MKILLLAGLIAFAGCDKKKAAEEAPPAEPTKASGLTAGGGPIADLQVELASDKSKVGKPLTLTGVLMNYSQETAEDGSKHVYAIVSDRKTQQKPNLYCFTKQTMEALDAMKLQQFERIVVEGTLAESRLGNGELRDCTLTRAP